MKIEQTFGEFIKGRRLAKRGMSQQVLARALGLAQPTISAWENDTGRPTLTTLRPLAKALGCKVDQLLDHV